MQSTNAVNVEMLRESAGQNEESTNELVRNLSGIELINQKTRDLKKFIKYHDAGGDLDFQKTRILFPHLPQVFLSTVQKQPEGVVQHTEVLVKQLKMMLNVYQGEISQRRADDIVQGGLDNKYLKQFMDEK